MKYERHEYFEIKIEKLQSNSNLWNQTIAYANNCSWNVGRHLAKLLEQDDFQDFEGVFIALSGNNIIGFCTFRETDYYPENRYFPWISSIFVDEEYRGNRISEKLIQSAINNARMFGFDKVYIPSNIIGLYEKYGFCKIDELENYDGDIDNIFMKKYKTKALEKPISNAFLIVHHNLHQLLFSVKFNPNKSISYFNEIGGK